MPLNTRSNVKLTHYPVPREFGEMPGLRLTTRQAARLFGVDERVCEATLSALVDAGHLVRHVDGRFSRSSGV